VLSAFSRTVFGSVFTAFAVTPSPRCATMSV
jgi:hypothetical protein